MLGSVPPQMCQRWGADMPTEAGIAVSFPTAGPVIAPVGMECLSLFLSKTYSQHMPIR